MYGLRYTVYVGSPIPAKSVASLLVSVKNRLPCDLRISLATAAIVALTLTPQFSRAQDAKPVLQKGLPNYPLDAVFAEDGTGYIVDRNLPGVWKWKDGELSVFFQASKKFRTPLNAPRCLAFDKDGTLLVGDTSTRDVYRVTGPEKAEPITGGKIGIPMDLAVAENGDIYVADLELKRVVRIPEGKSDPEVVAAVNPRGLTIDSKGQIWVIAQQSQQIQILSPDGKSTPVVEKRTFEFPHQIVVDESGTALITDGYKKAVWKITPGGKPEILVSGAPLDNPVGICLVEDEVRVIDPRARKVFRLTKENKLEDLIEIK